MPEIDGVYYEDEDYNDEDDWDGPYYDNYVPCPDVTLVGVVKKWIWLIKLRWDRWRHRDDYSDIPF